MSTLHFRAIGAVLGISFAAACGGDGPSGPSFADSASVENTEYFADDAVDAATEIIERMDFGTPQISIGGAAVATLRLASPAFTSRALLLNWRDLLHRPGGLGGRATEGCSMTTTGTTMNGSGFVDVNQNGIPDHLTFRWECTETDSTSSADTTYREVQLQEQTITENGASLHGYTNTVRWSYRSSDPFGNHDTYQTRYSETLDLRSDKATYRTRVEERRSYRFGEEVDDERQEAEWSGDFVPAIPIVRGAPLPNGLLTVRGRDAYSGLDYPGLSFTTGTAAPLAYAAGCSNDPPFTDGVLFGRLNGREGLASFAATFVGCGIYDIDTEGTSGPTTAMTRRAHD
jgi:hypothetical protein